MATQTEIFRITPPYEDWQVSPRGGGKAACDFPTVATVNGRGRFLTWDGKAWTGTASAFLALAERLDTMAERVLRGWVDRGIASRLNRRQAHTYTRIAESLRAAVAAGEAQAARPDETPG